jgi:hypothetical protein
MPEEQQAATGDDDNPGMDPVKPTTGTGGGGPGAKEAGIVGIVALALYLILFTLFVIYTMVKIWPDPTPSRQPTPQAATPTPTATPASTATTSVRSTPSPTPTPTPLQTPSPSPRAGTSSPTQSPTPTPTPTPSPSPSLLSSVTVLWWQFDIGDEQRLLLLVLLGGALGTLVHSLRSVYWYIGNRNLVKSWMAMYFMLPFAGAALAMVFYLVVRGGFFSPQSSFQQTSPFGFAAFAALIGMFSSQAVLKLKDVAEVMLSKAGGGANPQPQQSVTPMVQAPAPQPAQPGGQPPAGGNPPAVG